MYIIPKIRNVSGTFGELFLFFIVSVIPVEILLGLLTLSGLSSGYEYRHLALFFGLLCLVFSVVAMAGMIGFFVVWIRQRRMTKSRLGMWLGIISPLWLIFAAVTSLLVPLHPNPSGLGNFFIGFLGAYYGLGVALFLAISGLGSGFRMGKIGGTLTVFEFIFLTMLLLLGPFL